ncbi:MAG: transaldolase [Candidatus Lokiarchaeota archaeon]|nr:transaldolase [Candidatus Lokiarchaeota archaeon]MBD3343412.1 transaldolase [Candidatus Lokiarchaeota archaeon]
MKYFLDSAKIDEIKYALKNWKIDGVTSNPKHVKTSGKPFFTVVKEFAEEFKGLDFPISVEVDPHLNTAEEMVEEAKKIAALSDNFVIKIPCNERGLIATKRLTEEEVKVNVTLVFTVSQALQVGRLGASYCSPFIGWQEASGVDCTALIADIVTIYNNYDMNTEIIVAAVRNGKQIADAAVMGADIVTAGFQVYKDSFEHPFTDKGLKIFQNAWDETKLGSL